MQTPFLVTLLKKKIFKFISSVRSTFLTELLTFLRDIYPCIYILQCTMSYHNGYRKIYFIQDVSQITVICWANVGILLAVVLFCLLAQRYCQQEVQQTI